MPTPINEAKDMQVFDALRELVEDVRQEWQAASEATRKVMESSAGKAPEIVSAEIAGCWKVVYGKLASFDYVHGHLSARIQKTRIRGILEGDPRETELLAETI